jgi:hypothetical protein
MVMLLALFPGTAVDVGQSLDPAGQMRQMSSREWKPDSDIWKGGLPIEFLAQVGPPGTGWGPQFYLVQFNKACQYRSRNGDK